MVIVGGGFGGLETARRLRKADVRISLVDRHNYHLFQPLLYQVATGGLSPANIATPLRNILRKQSNCEILLAEVVDVDINKKRLIFADGEIDFDDLVVAAGATHSYFGREDWALNAPGLKSIDDATNIRRRIFLAFEAAEREADPDIRRALMTFVIVGGGPTGVELAGALSEIAQHTLKHDFRHIHPEDARILLVEASEHVLAHYPEDLCRRAADKIRSRGIEIHVHTKVTELTEDHVKLTSADGESIVQTRTVLWAAGVRANPLGKIVATACGVETDRAGRVPVTPQLNVDGHEHIFVIGDIAMCLNEAGKPLPGLAPVAMKQGEFVARRITDRIAGRKDATPFRYVDRGTMATIGRAAAVAQIGQKQFCGFFAWLLWLVVHLLQIVQYQNRVLILCQWAWSYLTFNRSSRLITGETSVVIQSAQQQPQVKSGKSAS
ncbi:MAG: NAD(P)/FAD-dependent oxidoreductase [Planctomycetaceae bacterium]|nr:NAD(P)/FAD-dependent oxidoreductase [Planctomycetaceae bacterium]